jgi:hypothetical protein
MRGLRTHCRNGHKYTVKNTGWVTHKAGPYRKSYTTRICRRCASACNKRRYDKNKLRQETENESSDIQFRASERDQHGGQRAHRALPVKEDGRANRVR